MKADDFVAGKELKVGVEHNPEELELTQTVTNSAKGELKSFKDKNGKEVSLYATDKHNEYAFEALLESDAPEKEVGDDLTINGKTCYVKSWDIVEKNDDAQLVRGTVRTFPDIES